MNHEDRIRGAFGDLADRVARDVRPAGDPSRGRGAPSRFGTGPILAVAALVIAAGLGAAVFRLAGDGGDQQVATDSTSTSTTATAPGRVTASTVDGAGGTDAGVDGGDADPDGGSDDDPGGAGGDGPAGTRFRVATELVAADAADPFLNMRGDPDARSDLLAKLPASYAGLLATTGDTETADDGGTWIEVELLHPVAVAETAFDGGGSVGGRRPTGWVNRAFVEPLTDGIAVGSDELAPCGIEAEGFGTAGTLRDGHVYAIESSQLTDNCLRVVLTFGAGQAPAGWLDLPDGTGPATAVPETITMSSGGLASSIDLGPVDAAWSGAMDTDDGIYLVRGDDGALDLLIPHQVDVIGVTARPEIGAIVIDLDIGDRDVIAGAGVVLTAEPLVSQGTIEVTGIARPFEAVVGVTVEDTNGRPVEATFSGNAQIGTRRETSYGAAANDWIDAWGRFAVRVEGLDSGQYTLVLNANDAADEPELLRIPVTLDEGGPAPTLGSEAEAEAAAALIQFAQGFPIGEAPLADEVILLLGPEVDTVAAADELADREAWTMVQPEGFAGFTGPFNPLSQLTNDRLRITAGPVAHCAGPPRDWPAELDGLRQVNIEAVGIDSCIAWFGVHLFLDEDGDIAAVAYDLFGP